MAHSGDNFPLETGPYRKVELTWPTKGKHILAHYDEESIIVYQAFNDKIADAALKANNFHSDDVICAGYNINRMTWIKTNFLWMMYRSGWGSKHNQTRILAIKITREGFEEILLNAKTRGGKVRLQWDPDHHPNGENVLGRKAIQLGLKGKMLQKFSENFIISIFDISDFVHEQAKAVAGKFESLTVPEEKVYKFLNETAGETVFADKF